MTAQPKEPSTWRDLIDELTPEQIAFYERMEAKFGDEIDHAFWLSSARNEAQSNMVGHIMGAELPIDATHQRWGHVADGEMVLDFDGTTREIIYIGIGDATVPQYDIGGECHREYPATISNSLSDSEEEAHPSEHRGVVGDG